MGIDAAENLIRIHLNREVSRSPNPTTGDALYILAGVGKREKLYREVEGDGEDEWIPRDEAVVRLTPDEHFHSQAIIEILVNGDEHGVDVKEITYSRIVDLYVGSGGQPSNEYLVKYSLGPIVNASGVLAPGQKVELKDGMRFRVAGTGES